MKSKISKSQLYGEITCPANKSYTHRAVFLASLAQGKSKIENALRSDDTNATIGACRSFGAQIDESDSVLEIKNNTILIQSSKIDAANSGTTIRIAAAIASLSEQSSILTGDTSLQKRPMQPLLDALESIGAKCTSNQGNPPITIQGKISGGDVKIPGNISSQFITAILIAAPLTERGISLEIKGDLVSKPYLDATIAAMKKFGVTVQTTQQHKKYLITRQAYQATNFVVPSDFSSLALLLAAAVLVGGSLSIKVELGDLPQGDKAFLEILEKLGVTILFHDAKISVQSPDKLKGGAFDLSNTPDILPALAILALKSENPIEIFNVRHARFKETDRIKIICRELEKLGLDISEKEDGMILQNTHKLTGADLDSQGDHRLFMAFCIAGMYVGESTVSDPESASVSYPDFVSEIGRVGGRIEPYNEL